MKIIEPSHEIFFLSNAVDLDELACKIKLALDNDNSHGIDIFSSSMNSDPSYMLKKEHNDTIHDFIMTAKLVCDYDIGHQLARYHLEYYKGPTLSQLHLSIDEPKDEITVIKQLAWKENSNEYGEWIKSIDIAEKSYFQLINLGASHHDASRVLPNSLKCEIGLSITLREWRHILLKVFHNSQSSQMKQIMGLLLIDIKKNFDKYFNDIEISKGNRICVSIF